MKETTNRGFRVFGRITDDRGTGVRVQESSAAGRGAHVWLFTEGDCVDHLGKHQRPDAHLNYHQAKALIEALQAFVHEAEAGQLAEPATVEDDK